MLVFINCSLCTYYFKFVTNNVFLVFSLSNFVQHRAEKNRNTLVAFFTAEHASFSWSTSLYLMVAGTMLKFSIFYKVNFQYFQKLGAGMKELSKSFPISQYEVTSKNNIIIIFAFFCTLSVFYEYLHRDQFLTSYFLV